MYCLVNMFFGIYGYFRHRQVHLHAFRARKVRHRTEHIPTTEVYTCVCVCVWVFVCVCVCQRDIFKHKKQVSYDGNFPYGYALLWIMSRCTAIKSLVRSSPKVQVQKTAFLGCIVIMNKRSVWSLVPNEYIMLIKSFCLRQRYMYNRLLSLNVCCLWINIVYNYMFLRNKHCCEQVWVHSSHNVHELKKHF